MTATIIARFADGRLLVNESKLVEQGYKISSTIGVPFRIGHIKTIEQVLSLDAHVSGYPGTGRLGSQLQEALISGDTLLVVLRRVDQPNFQSGASSGYPSWGPVSNVTSGLEWGGELVASGMTISGKVSITANVIGF